MVFDYIFGPVPSRRLGLSLGVDIVPYKTCSFDCIYCECGKTTDIRVARSQFVDKEKLFNELEAKLSLFPDIDFITFSGAGEPTLNSEIGEIAEKIKKEYPGYKLALLTNSSLFYDKTVREQLLKIDLVVPSLDAVSEKNFLKINKPYYSVSIKDIIRGLIHFREEFKGILWLEVFIVPGVNDTEEELKKLKNTLLKISPDKVHINSLDRPSAYGSVMPATEENLIRISDYMSPLKVFPVTKKNTEEKELSRCFSGDREKISRIQEYLRHRPATPEELCTVFSLSKKVIIPYLQELENSGKIKKYSTVRGEFYRIL
jgi:wyosine [tRNA(Phe)-imidazoG37] synthetase (radical SAM superfamily)